mgnify:CR=1 FL=1
MPTRTARTAWNGTLETGSGQVELSSSKVGTYDVSFPKRAADEAGGTTSPEELVAAAHSSCFAMQFSALIAEAGGTPQSLEVTADVSLGADPAGGDAINTAESLALPLEFKHDINAYLAALPGTHPRDLAGLIAFNKANARREMPFFGQEIFEQAQATSGDETEPAYVKARQDATGGARKALDDVLGGLKLDAIVSLTNGPAWTTDLVNGDHFSTGSSTFAAVSGYPSVTVPAGYTNGLPIGISFTGRRWSEETLLRLAFAFEKGNPVRKAPTYAATLPVSDGVRARLQRRGFVGSMQGRIG